MRILYACHDLDYWRAHRLGLARRMVGEGHQVALLCGMPPDLLRAGGGAVPMPDATPPLVSRRDAPGAGSSGELERARRRVDEAGAGLWLPPSDDVERIIPGGRLALAALHRQRLDPRRDMAFGRAIRAAAREFRADVVHLITLKPILFGGAALRLGLGASPRLVATFPGLGRVFARPDPDARQRLLTAGLRVALSGRNATAVFENAADRERLVAARVVPPRRSAVIGGAGFDPAEFPAQPMPPGPAEGAPLRCLFAARMLRAKGVGEVIAAARILAAERAPVRFTLAGPTGGDADALTGAELAALEAEPNLQFLGAVPGAQMADLIAAHHLLLLPTRYPEGTPRILSEAGAVGRPSIVSAHPGCTAFIRDGREGLVVEPPTGPALAEAIRGLLRDPGRLAAMGAAAQRRALEGGFSLDAVADDYARLYRGEAVRFEASPAA